MIDARHVVFWLLTLLVLEIVLGAILGVVVWKLASLYRNTRSLGSIVMNVVFQPLTPYLMVLASGLLLKANIWLNPAPIIFGMGIHAAVVTTREPIVEPGPPSGRIDRTIKVVLYCGVVVTAWVLLVVQLLRGY